jgi:hypothetical protein
VLESHRAADAQSPLLSAADDERVSDMKIIDYTIADGETAAQARWRMALENVGQARPLQMTEPVNTPFAGVVHDIPKRSADYWHKRRAWARARRLERDAKK